MAKPIDSTTWKHHQLPLLGISDLALPPNHTLEPSTEPNSSHIINVRLNDLKTRLDIRLLFTAELVARELKTLPELCPSTPGDDFVTVVQSPIILDLDKGTFPAAKTCSFYLKPYGDDAADVTHLLVLQSPFGHGLCLDFKGPFARFDEIRQTAAQIIKTLHWVDRMTVVKDISSQLHGSWTENSPLPAHLANPGCSANQTITVNYLKGGTFTASKTVNQVRNDNGRKTTEERAMPGGSYQAFQLPTGSLQLLTVGDEYGEVSVKMGELVNKDMLEIDQGRTYLHRVVEKQSFWKRLGKKTGK